MTSPSTNTEPAKKAGSLRHSVAISINMAKPAYAGGGLKSAIRRPGRA
jgi:hypothetical protein